MSNLQRILYVDDEPDIQAIVKTALESLGGFTVYTCDCGADAVTEVPVFKPDMILLDVMMPGLNGIETFDALKALPDMADTPVVFVTAKAQSDELNKYKALGAAGTIPKPFDPITLSDDLHQIWKTVVVVE